MDALSLFGLFAVTAMLVCYALEDRDHLLSSRSRPLARWPQFTDFSRAPGHLALSRRFGQWSRCGAGTSGGA